MKHVLCPPVKTALAEKLKLVKIRQSFTSPRLSDLQTKVREEMKRSGVTFPGGKEIAVAVGSRGIANLEIIVRAVVDYLRDEGVRPFIVPAMGSHGGATAAGQKETLEALGISEGAMGCEIRSSMEVVALPCGGLNFPLYMDRQAHESSGIVVINRIKPHTDFHGRFESGLLKMAVIGLGKERQAFEMHRFGTYGLKELVPKAAEQVLGTGKIILGLGIVENAYEETAWVEAIPAAKIMEREAALLEIARDQMARLPVRELDLLIVDRLGKNVSGTGMDTNIIGRIGIDGEVEPQEPKIKSIVITGLTAESHGNATGIGLADVVTEGLFKEIDFEKTYTNIVTSGFLGRGKLPIVARSDAQAVEIGLRGAGWLEIGRERVVRVRDTLHLVEMYVSQIVLEELGGTVEVLGEFEEIFNNEGKLHPF